MIKLRQTIKPYNIKCWIIVLKQRRLGKPVHSLDGYDGGPLTEFRVGGLFYAGVQGLSPGTKTGLDWEEEDGRAVELSKTA